MRRKICALIAKEEVFTILPVQNFILENLSNAPAATVQACILNGQITIKKHNHIKAVK